MPIIGGSSAHIICWRMNEWPGPTVKSASEASALSEHPPHTEVPARVHHGAHQQGLTLVHFSAQLEPCLTHKNTLHNLRTP
jgi:hypothetical protein